ncbi:PEP-CTERM sorting domain-containing protein [Lentisalinibacter salinarum]|uniref:PEP-CTERM sorting domain-containing protein n=1 Tax=Lentisalinibacter salinarum TaxID=2992239 RepID=UPI0038703D2E
MKILKKTLIAACFLAMGHSATAAVISWVPADGEGNVGDDIIMDLVWTGEAGEYLGDFDIQILWDAAIAGLSDVTIDPDLGVDSAFGCDAFAELIGQCGQVGGAGDTSIFHVSFDDVGTLTANQDSLGNAFTLATFTFVGASVGVTDLTFGQVAVFGEEFGVEIVPTLSPGRICVGPDGCPIAEVPEPTTLALLGIGLIGAGFARRRAAAA